MDLPAPPTSELAASRDGPSGQWMRPLRFHLSVVVVLLLVTTAAVLIGLNSYQGRKAAIAAARREMSTFCERIVDRYRTVFGGAEALLELASRSEVVAKAAYEDQNQLGTFLNNMLLSSDSIDGTYVGYASGAFVHAVSVANNPLWRDALSAPQDATSAIRIISADEVGRRISSWTFLDGDGRPVGGTHPRPANYDPRQRTWYRQASADPAPITTQPYRMASTGAWGITLARRHLTHPSLIVGFDVLLSRIDAFLATQKLTPDSGVFIFNAANELVSRSDPEAAGRPETAVPLASRITAMAAHLRRGASDYRTFHLDRRAYLMVAWPVSDTPLLEEGHVVAVTPMQYLTSASDRLRDQGLLISGIVLSIGIATTLVVARGISASLTEIAAQAKRLRDLDFATIAASRSHITEIEELSTVMTAARSTISAFGHYVPRQLVRRIIGSREQAHREGERQIVTVLFSDIQDFTTISERHSAEDVIRVLSEYFDIFSEVIQRHLGVIIQFSGDSVFALWNAPQFDELHVDRACECVLELALRVREFNLSQRRRGAPETITRFGLHTGAAVVGSVGAEDRFQYTAMGDVVNVASRLEHLNKELGTTILVSRAVVNGARKSFPFTRIGPVHLKGREGEVEVFELRAEPKLA